MDESAAEQPISVPVKSDKMEQTKKKKKVEKTNSQNSSENIDEKNDRLHSTATNNETKSRSESPTDEYNVVDYNTLIPAIAMDCGSDTESKKEPPKTEPIILKKVSQIDKVSNQYLFYAKIIIQNMIFSERRCCTNFKNI